MNTRIPSRIVFFFFAAVLMIRGAGYAQTSFNPEISVIPRFLVSTNDGTRLPEVREFSQPEFTLEELEIALQAYLNPYARGDIFLSKHGLTDDPVEIEEAYASFLRGLPLDLNARIGKYLADFGKLNMMHPHVWPFARSPLVYQRFLGEEGLNDIGISLSVLLPTGDLYTKLVVDILRGTNIGEIEAGGGMMWGGVGLTDTTGGRVFYANSARLMTFVPVSDESDIEIGLSGYTGIHDPYARLRFWYTALDFKYKWKPSQYTSLTIQGEALLNFRDASEGADPQGVYRTRSVSSGGFYAYADYQFARIFTLGGRIDWAQAPYHDNDKAQGFSLFFGFYPVEETTAFRFEYQRTTTQPHGGPTTVVNSLALQFIFSMGPHRVHPF